MNVNTLAMGGGEIRRMNVKAVVARVESETARRWLLARCSAAVALTCMMLRGCGFLPDAAQWWLLAWCSAAVASCPMLRGDGFLPELGIISRQPCPRALPRRYATQRARSEIFKLSLPERSKAPEWAEHQKAGHSVLGQQGLCHCTSSWRSWWPWQMMNHRAAVPEGAAGSGSMVNLMQVLLLLASPGLVAQLGAR